jgi:hypothetical protein
VGSAADHARWLAAGGGRLGFWQGSQAGLAALGRAWDKLEAQTVGAGEALLRSGLSHGNMTRLEALAQPPQRMVVAWVAASWQPPAACPAAAGPDAYWALLYKAVDMAWRYFDEEAVSSLQGQQAGGAAGPGQAKLHAPLAMWRGPLEAKLWLAGQFREGRVARRGERRRALLVRAPVPSCCCTPWRST